MDISDITYTKSIEPASGEPVLYVQKQLIKIWGEHVRIFDSNKRLLSIAYGIPLKLKEKIEIYSDEHKKYKLMTSSTNKIIDFNVTFSIKKPDGTEMGTLRRKGWSSEFLRDVWEVYNEKGELVADVFEESRRLGLIRRYLFAFIPQTYIVQTRKGDQLKIKQSWNPVHLRYRAYCQNYKIFQKQLSQNLLIGILSTLAIIEGRE